MIQNMSFPTVKQHRDDTSSMEHSIVSAGRYHVRILLFHFDIKDISIFCNMLGQYLLCLEGINSGGVIPLLSLWTLLSKLNDIKTIFINDMPRSIWKGQSWNWFLKIIWVYGNLYGTITPLKLLLFWFRSIVINLVFISSLTESRN